jgi:predicted DNA-binding transcriptional regulator AlpA
VDESEILLTTNEVARTLRLRPRSVRGMARRRTLPPPVRIGRCLRWRRCDIERFIASRDDVTPEHDDPTR